MANCIDLDAILARGVKRGETIRRIDRILRQHDDADSCADDCCGCWIMDAEALAQFYRSEYDLTHQTTQAIKVRDWY